jgi:protein transport protein SEC23
MAASTGGKLVLTDSFRTSIFKQSFIRLFNQDSEGFLEMGFCGTLKVNTTQELKISGLLGHASSAHRKSERVAETETGIGGTDGWNLCGVSPRDAYAIVFDVVSGSAPTVLGNSPPPETVFQFVTQYVHSSSTYRLRVTTVSRPLATQAVGRTAVLAESFDQECAAALLARMAAFKLDKAIPVADVIKWLDSTLIRACIHFATYAPGDSLSFRLPPSMTYLPQFMYHLRRSQFLQVFNNSPDETAFYRHVLNCEDVTNTSVMIQPTLTAYEIDKDPEPVLLDSLSLTPDRVLLLDTYFHILIYHGETVAAWRRAGYQDREEYTNFKQMLQTPRADAAELLADRFPLPRFIDTEAGGSQARFLLSRLNPSRQGPTGTSLVLTDDVSLQDFMQYLINLTVKSDKKG